MLVGNSDWPWLTPKGNFTASMIPQKSNTSHLRQGTRCSQFVLWCLRSLGSLRYGCVRRQTRHFWVRLCGDPSLLQKVLMHVTHSAPWGEETLLTTARQHHLWGNYGPKSKMTDFSRMSTCQKQQNTVTTCHQYACLLPVISHTWPNQSFQIVKQPTNFLMWEAGWNGKSKIFNNTFCCWNNSQEFVPTQCRFKMFLIWQTR